MGHYCENCTIALNILNRNFDWYKELSIGNVHSHEELSMLFDDIYRKQADLSNLHVASLEERAHNLFLCIDKQINHYKHFIRPNVYRELAIKCDVLVRDLYKTKRSYLEQFTLASEKKTVNMLKHAEVYNKLFEKYNFAFKELDAMQSLYFEGIKKQLEKQSIVKSSSSLQKKESDFKKKLKKLEASMKSTLKTIEGNQNNVINLDQVVNILLQKNKMLLQNVFAEKQILSRIIAEYEKTIRKLQGDLSDIQMKSAAIESQRLDECKAFESEIKTIRLQIKVLEQSYNIKTCSIKQSC